MYAGGLDEPIYRPYIARDWRFGHYEMDGLQDPVSRLWRSITAPITRKKKKASVLEEDDLEYQDCNKLSNFIT
ncbi:Beta-glucosidase-like SFR2, chloroplastic [Dendrobium catenatum]|uniref:Beta-glucosidase-like SFR2, chloroplastic n=2 Tax=Dendrobium TaxID=37818 RepID=A0A2I0XI28_9ASPA|nr:Beta-glucosidase-like SFR2, chloroplastic [Dendrobium catenatum]